jgi:hypothetical protein
VLFLLQAGGMGGTAWLQVQRLAVVHYPAGLLVPFTCGSQLSSPHCWPLSPKTRTPVAAALLSSAHEAPGPVPTSSLHQPPANCLLPTLCLCSFWDPLLLHLLRCIWASSSPGSLTGCLLSTSLTYHAHLGHQTLLPGLFLSPSLVARPFWGI